MHDLKHTHTHTHTHVHTSSSHDSSLQGVEPNYTTTTLTPDYSIESHSRDIPTFLATARSRHRRAKALLGKTVGLKLNLLNDCAYDYDICLFYMI